MHFLTCAEGIDKKVVASRQRVTPQTVSKWRTRFVEHRLDGLLDAPRPCAPRMIDDAHVDAAIAKTLESVSDAATHWSTRAMRREAGRSQTAVSRIWRAFGLQPHRQETSKRSSDPPVVEKVRDIAGLYQDPPLKAMVLGVGEKSHPVASRVRRGRADFCRRPVLPSDAPMTTSATARPRCSQRWTSAASEVIVGVERTNEEWIAARHAQPC